MISVTLTTHNFSQLNIDTMLCTGSYILMFRMGIGFWGCGVATSLARAVMLAALCRYLYVSESDDWDA